MRSLTVVILCLLMTLSSWRMEAQCADELYTIDPCAALMRDLMIVDQVNCCLCDRMPVTYNFIMGAGYFNMHSARMSNEGSFKVGFASVPPYYNLSLGAQPFSHLETTLSYRIYRGIDDPILSPLGFGDLSDRGINVKFALALPEDSNYLLPGVAIGADDFLGTKGFKSLYIVATQVWPRYNFEFSLGFGTERLKGMFGGVLWMPLRQSCNPYLSPIALSAEYDATDYGNPLAERHPAGRDFTHRINFGLKYRLWDYFDFTVAQVRGKAFAWSVSTEVELGAPYRLIPLLDDPTPYCAPVITEPIGCLRTETVLAEDLVYSFRHQGFDVWDITLSETCCGEQELRLKVSTDRWMYECLVFQRIQDLVLSLTPSNIDVVVVTVETRGFPVQEYRFRQDFLANARCKEISRCELALLTREDEACVPNCCGQQLLYKRHHPWANLYAAPKMRYLFGSSQGKFKYALGVTVGCDGFLFDQLFYRFQLGYIGASSIPNSHQDVLNPSQLMNVHTDILTYYQQRSITVDEALLQKNMNLGKGLYSRFSTGLFSQFYGGFAGEFLYYPVGSCWAVGVEYAKVYKRDVKGVGFRRTIRKLDGQTPTWIKFNGYQYFLDGYYIWDSANIDLRVSLGRFLAGDNGARFEVGRSYASGLRIWAWYTYTDGHDHINGHLYFDQGVGFSMPIDAFLTHSSTERWGEAISAWLRDVGYRTETGDGLFDLIHNLRL